MPNTRPPILKFGKLPARHDPRTLKLSKYLGLLPPPPVKVQYPGTPKTWPMYLNDQLGDCVAAAAGHMIQDWTSISGDPALPSDQQIQTFYEGSGYIPGDPSTDQGWDLLSALKMWRTTGCAGHKIAAFVQLKTRNIGELKQAIQLFGSAYVGVELPDSVVPDNGTDWTKIPWTCSSGCNPNPNNGHCIPIMAYNENKFYFPSWAAWMVMTDNFYSLVSDEAYAVVTTDWIEKNGKSPSGFALNTLLADLQVVTA